MRELDEIVARAPIISRERFGEFSVLHRPAQGGDGLTVHFAHATGFNAETYRALFQSLDPSLDVFAMDARGHGMSLASADPRKLRSWAPYREDLERFVETLPQPMVLAGHSMGATVSLELAASRPDLVGGLVLIDPVIMEPSRIPILALARLLGLSPRLVPIARAAARRRTEFPTKEAAVENYVGKGAFKTWPREWIEAYVEGGTVGTSRGTVRLSCDRAWESRTFAMSSVNPYRAVKKLRCPITLIARDDDATPFTRASRLAFMRLRPETRLVLLEDASHFSPMERPEVVRAEIERLAATVRSQLR
jgi:pimeloyl-ACP methyl ester carboxylesterase